MSSILYFAFANDKENPLPELYREYQAVEQRLKPLEEQGHFKLEMRPFASLPDVLSDLALYQNDLKLFHFSGHAGRDRLLLEDGTAMQDGIGPQLGACPNLELIVLNGCATAGQVELLQSLNIPAVIATRQEVNDSKARLFSEVFYRLLAFYQPLDRAWTAAANAVKSKDPSVEIRSLALRKSESSSESVWGLHLLPERTDWSKSWTLPDEGYRPEAFEPNSLLIPTLAEALAPYHKSLERLLRREREGKKAPLYKKREQIVKCLPRPIGTGIRSLVSESTPKDGSGNKFYNREDENRLGQLLLVFEIAIELQAFVMLAQLWDEMDPRKPGKTPLRLTSAEAEPVHAFLTRRGQDLNETMDLIRHLRRLFDDHRIDYFLDELADIKKIFLPGEPFHDSARWLADLHRNLGGRLPSAQQGRTLCAVTERHLCNVLREMGFLARYLFASVKKIDVKKYRSDRAATFEHEVVQLVSDRITGDGADYPELDEYFDIKSVLLLKGRFGESPDLEEDIEEALNLSPFVIDHNAFDTREAALAKLYFFRACRPEADIYQYRFIDLLKDKPLVVDARLPANQAMHYVLKRQFDHFFDLLSNPKTETDAQPV